jgi:uncharacterized protein (DUF488 family)
MINMADIFTIGHSNLEINRFIGILKDNEISVVVDIRSVPFSRFSPQYNRKNLENEFAKRSILYEYEGNDLGGRIKDKECYITKTIPDRKTNIAQLIDFTVLENKIWFQNGIKKIIELSSGNKTVIMCSEENPDNCHRKLLVGKKLELLGHRIIHLRSKLNNEEQFFLNF